MKEFYIQECPLCAVLAKYYYVDAKNRKYFNCPNCRLFQISWRAEELLASKSSEYKLQFANVSKNAEVGFLLTILTPDIMDKKQDQNVSLVAKMVSKSNAPLN